MTWAAKVGHTTLPGDNQDLRGEPCLGGCMLLLSTLYLSHGKDANKVPPADDPKFIAFT